MEAFGNAKTTRNNNSSRFGKFIQLTFDNSGMSGASVVPYLLEKSRVCRQGPNERNFHVFYQLLAGVDDDERKAFGLSTETFRYLVNGMVKLPGVDDAEEFYALKDSFSCLNIDEKKQASIFSILAAILHIGNVQFKGKEKVEIPSTADISLVSTLLKVDQKVLVKALTTRSITVKNQTTEINLKIDQANDNKDTLSKTLYEKLFQWLISSLNSVLKEVNARKHWVGILDIFGFEDFHTNSLEQLLINYTNEKLKTFSNRHIFKLEQEEYEKEKINWSSIQFQDDTICLNMFESKTGLFSILDEQCRFPSATDTTMLEKLNSTLSAQADVFHKPKLAKDSFVVVHYAGEVTYNVTDFLEKNRNTLLQDVIILCSASKDKLISALFRDELQPLAVESPNSTMRGQKLTVVSIFKRELDTLVQNLLRTETLFVRCVKPNLTQNPGNFAKDVVDKQLRYLNMQETVKIRKLGFPVRLTHIEFVDRYRVLLPNLPANKEKACEILVQGLKLDPNRFQKGLTKVFFKQAQYTELEEQRNEALLEKAITIQSFYRGVVFRRYFVDIRLASRVLQNVARTYIARSTFQEIRKSTLILQGVARMLKAKKLLATLRQIELEKRLERERKEREEQERVLREKREQIQRQKEEQARKKREQEEKELKERQQRENDEKERREQERLQKIQEEEKLRQKLLDEEAKAHGQSPLQFTESLDMPPQKPKPALPRKPTGDDAPYQKPLPVPEKKKDPAVASSGSSSNIAVSNANTSGISPTLIKPARKVGISQEDRLALKMQQGGNASMREMRESKIVGTGRFNMSSKDKHISLRPNTLRASKMVKEGAAAASSPSAPRQSILTMRKEPSSGAKSRLTVSKTRFPNLDRVFNNSTFASLERFAALSTPIFTVLLSTVGTSSAPKQTAKTRTRGKTSLNPTKHDLPEIVSQSETSKYNWLGFVSENFQTQSTGTFKKRKLKPQELGSFSKDKLHQSLLRLGPEAQKQALEAWIAILSYVGIGTHMSEDGRELATKVIFAGISSVSLRDELYCQLMRILTNPPQVVIAKRGWQLMSFFCACFVPSHNLLKYLITFLINGTVDIDTNIANVATYCLRTIRRNYAHNFGQDRRLPPSGQEFEALEARQALTIIVYFYDGFELEVQIDSAATVQAVFQEAINCVGLRDESKYLYSLMETHNELERTLHMDENICDILSKWDLFRLAKPTSAISNEFAFFIKQHVFVSSYTTQDLVQEDLLFHQSITTILRGVWPTEEKDALLLGAYQACFEKQTTFDADTIQQFIPRPLFHLHRPDEWIQLLKSKMRENEGLAPDTLETSYVRVMQKLPLFGTSVFPVTHKKAVTGPKQAQWASLPDAFDLHVHEHGIDFALAIPRARVKRTLRSWTYDEVLKVSQTELSVGLTLVPYEDEPECTEIWLTTIQGIEIYTLIREYSEHHVRGATKARLLFDLPRDAQNPDHLAARKGQPLVIVADRGDGWLDAKCDLSVPFDPSASVARISLGSSVAALSSSRGSALASNPSSANNSQQQLPLMQDGRVPARNVRLFKEFPGTFAKASLKSNNASATGTSSPSTSGGSPTATPTRSGSRVLLAVPDRRSSSALASGSSQSASGTKSSGSNTGNNASSVLGVNQHKLIDIFQERFRTTRVLASKEVAPYPPQERVAYSPRFLDHSLLRLEEKLDKPACEHFNMLLKFIQDPSDPHDGIPMLARLIKFYLLGNKALVDEIYVQAIKQTKGNDDYTKNLKAWAYFAIVCGVVPPSEWLEKYVFSHIEANLVDPTEVGQYATDAYKRFNGLMKHAAQREQPPSPDEMNAIFFHEIFSLDVLLPNGVDKATIPVDPWVTVDEAIWKVCLQTGVKNDVNFALWEVDPSVTGSVEQLNGNAYLVDVLFLMEAKQASLNQMQKHYLLFKRDLAMSDDKSIPTLEVELKLLYDEAVFSVANTTFMIDILPTFVAFQLQIMHGNCDTKKDPFSTIGRMIEGNLKGFMSRVCFNLLCQNLVTYKQFIKSVQEEWVRLEGVPSAQCQKLYIEEYFNHPVAGSTVFPVEERGKKNKVLFAINGSGVFIVNEATTKQEIVRHITWKSIQSWRVEKDFFHLQHGSLAKPTKSAWKSKDVRSLSYVFHSYNTILVERFHQKNRGEERVGPRKRFEEERKSRITIRLSTRTTPVHENVPTAASPAPLNLATPPTTPSPRPALPNSQSNSAFLKRGRGESRPKSVQIHFNFEDADDEYRSTNLPSPRGANLNNSGNNNNNAPPAASSTPIRRDRGLSIKDQFNF